MEASQHLAVLPEVETGEVEIGKLVALADIEEEVGGSAVVPVLE